MKSQISDFCTDHPRLWFGQFEVIVASSKQGENPKSNLVIAKLGKDSIQHVADLVLQPPKEKPYTTLKERLLVVYEESETRKMQKLLSEIDLGVKKPSQLLRRMKDLALDKIPEETLRILWIGHLPASARAILTVSEVTDLNKLAQMADKVTESAKHDSQVTEISTNTPTSSNELLIPEIS